MTIGFKEWRLSDDWSGDERQRDCLLPEVSSQRTPGPCWEQLWGFAKVRYRGLAKNLARAQTMFALANLYQVRRQLLNGRWEVGRRLIR